jgi:hypothetical protein
MWKRRRLLRALLFGAAFLSVAARAQDPQPPAQRMPPQQTPSPDTKGSSAPAQPQNNPPTPQPPDSSAPPQNDDKPVPPQGPIQLPPTLPEVVVRNPSALCVQPPPGVRIQDYDGPFAKTVGIFANRLDRRTVQPARAPQFKSDDLICTLPLKGKFLLFVNDSVDPVTFFSAGYNALISQAENSEPAFGQGFKGYGLRFGTNLAGSSSSAFFGDFLYPTIFSQDPRFYRLGHGTFKRRVIHALTRTIIAHDDHGGNMFNYTQWLGTASTVVLSNTYLPDNNRSASHAAEVVGFDVLNDAGFDVLREFWPEIAKKFKLPFRDRSVAPPGP